MKLGFLEDLQKEVEDPIAHFEALAAQMTQEEKDSQVLARIDISNMEDIEEDEVKPKPYFRTTHLGIPLLLRIYYELNLDKLAAKIDSEVNVDFNFQDFFQYYFIVHYLFPIYYVDSFELQNYFFCRMDFDGPKHCEQFYGIIRVYEKDVRDWLRASLDPEDFEFFDAHYQQLMQNTMQQHFSGREIVSHYLSVIDFKNISDFGWMTMDYIAYVVLEIIVQRMRNYHSQVKVAQSLTSLYCYNIYGDVWVCAFKDTVTDKLFKLSGIKPPAKFISTTDIMNMYPEEAVFSKALIEYVEGLPGERKDVKASKNNETAQVLEIKKDEHLEFKSRHIRNLAQALPLRYFYKLGLEPILKKIGRQHKLNFDVAQANKYLLAIHSSFLYEFCYNSNLRLISPFENKFSVMQLLRFYRCMASFMDDVRAAIAKFLGPEQSQEFKKIYQRDFDLPLRGHRDLIETVLGQSMKNFVIDDKLANGYVVYDLIVKCMVFYLCKKFEFEFNMANFNMLIF
ncbi:MAG: hypothetical protein HUJ63_10920, partial [Enterococcus sp.]|nr:hypothetical protein [Enterococcus sp.]